MNEFKIAETDSFSKKIRKKEYRQLYGKIQNFVYPLLRENPYFGPNIKKLKGNLSHFYRYRIGNYRLFYQIIEDQVIVAMADIAHRKESYK